MVKELLERVEGKVIRELKKQYPDVELYDENDLAGGNYAGYFRGTWVALL